MSNSSIDHAYQYPFASTLENQRWVMAASSGPSLDEHTFFDGRLTRPDVTARLLLVLSHIVRTHFYDARPPQMDPIATSSPRMVRFEGFSGCCGVYARVDLDQRAFAEASQTFGTTNVDFNPPMIAHLARISRSDDTSLAITRDSGAVRILRQDGDQYDLEVPGSGVNQFVRLRPEGDRCSCIWFSRHQGQRGPCKHVLAARLKVRDLLT